MSGPQFQEQEQEENQSTIGWMQKNKTKSIVLIIALVVLAGGLYLFNKKKTGPTASILNETAQSQSPTTNNQATQGLNTNKDSKTVVPLKEEVTDKEFKERAQTGEGITHMARRATKSYLDQNPDLKGKITKEQKIYIEDYLKNRIKEGLGQKGISPNDKISFDKDLIKKAIEASQKLTQKQLDNLTKYTILVPSL